MEMREHLAVYGDGTTVDDFARQCALMAIQFGMHSDTCKLDFRVIRENVDRHFPGSQRDCWNLGTDPLLCISTNEKRA